METNDSRVDGAPVGEGTYVVQSGECLGSIAHQHGHFWKTLWSLPENAELKDKRKSPFVLLPGDRVFIPELRSEQESAQAGQSLRFRRKGIPAMLRLRLLEDGEPLADERYRLDIDGRLVEGQLDEQGQLHCVIPPNASSASIYLEGDDEPTMTVRLGTVDPPNTVTGIQGRLNSLGYEAGKIDGDPGPRTQAAIARFQRERGLDVTGTVTDETLSMLDDAFTAKESA